MPPKKRKSAVIATAEEQQPSSSNKYKRKLRSSKQEPSSSNIAVDAATDKQQPLHPQLVNKKLHRQKREDKNQKYTIKLPRPQRFSLPESIIYYIARNLTNGPCHQNVIMSCKLLFRMSKIIPVERAKAKYNGSIFIMAKNKSNEEKELCIDLKRKVYGKLWIYDKLDIPYFFAPSNFASTLAKQVHKCSLTDLRLCNQELSFEELQILIAGGKLRKVWLVNNAIKNGDGSITEFEKVFEALYCKDMHIILARGEEHGIGKETTAKIIKILESTGKEYTIRIRDIQEAFDIQVFSDFLKANLNNDRQHTINLNFIDTISFEYKEQLQKLVDELIQIRGIYAHTVPLIYFPDQNIDSYFKLRKMREHRVEGILKKPGAS